MKNLDSFSVKELKDEELIKLNGGWLKVVVSVAYMEIAAYYEDGGESFRAAGEAGRKAAEEI